MPTASATTPTVDNYLAGNIDRQGIDLTNEGKANLIALKQYLGGGVAGTTADGADVTQGAIADAAVAAGASGTVSAKLRAISRDIGTLNTALATGATRTPTITTPSTGATIAAGKRYIEFIFSSDFAGTIGGQTFSGTTDFSYNLPLLNGADTYAALVYTISAGSARLTTIV